MTSVCAAGSVRSEFAEDADFRELLEMFVDALSEKRASMLACHQSGDYEQLLVLAHQLKGSSGGYGFPELSQLAASLEQASRSKSAVGVAQSLAELLSHMERVVV